MEKRLVADADTRLRPLVESDLELLYLWLNAPHLKPFYMQEPISAEHIRQKYMPRLTGNDPCHSLIAETDGTPFGYIQWYLNNSFPNYGTAVIGEANGVSFDYYIGSTDHLGAGLGPVMLNLTVSLVSHRVGEADKTFFVGHHIKNAKAIRCSERAGFSYRRDFVEKGAPSALYARDER